MNNNDDHIFYRNRKKRYPIVDRGEGVYLYDTEGNKYLDASGGPMVVNIGHGVKEITDAIVMQADKVSFPYVAHFASEAQINFSREVLKLTPAGMSKVYPVAGGSEATEIAIKLVRQYFLGMGMPDKTKIIGRWQSYHGATIGSLSVGGHSLYRKDYEPYLINFPHIPPPYCYRCPFEKKYPECEILCAQYLEKAIKDENKNTVAAFIVEPITGGTLGACTPPVEYFKIIREICDKYGLLLVLDEVVTGFGRTGKNFGIDHYEVSPDIIITAKGASSGYIPLGSVIINEKIFEVFNTKRTGFPLGYTYSGQPLTCAVGEAVLKYIEANDLIHRAEKMGKYLFKRFKQLNDIPIVGDIRGKGLLLGIELVQSKDSKTPFSRNKKVAESIVKKAFQSGLIVLPGHGFEDNLTGDIIMLAPPFIIKEKEIDNIYDILEPLIMEYV